MNKNSKFKLGVKLLIASGFFPIIVGLINYFLIMSKLSLEHWLSVFMGRPYSNGDLPLLDETFYSLGHLGFTNLIATGVTLCVVSFYSVNQKQRWGWFLILFLLIWVGGNDLILSTWRYLKYDRPIGLFPMPIFPVILGSFGLALTWSSIKKA